MTKAYLAKVAIALVMLRYLSSFKNLIDDTSDQCIVKKYLREGVYIMSTRKSNSKPKTKTKTNELMLLEAKENHKFIIDFIDNRHFLPFLNIVLSTVVIGIIAGICIYKGQLANTAILVSDMLMKLFVGRK
ncbi:hypothetical protein [Clostridium estertheticum]|uniref:hypothetical protein n=2 Tax=Clostridium estertheticum TaxID=238834 RepID=UPI001CF1DD25|nr:hypothetical protein [Clostridium estertheticum]MCB2361622.1 hypothetical protein [Clostridium estertheticum]